MFPRWLGKLPFSPRFDGANAYCVVTDDGEGGDREGRALCGILAASFPRDISTSAHPARHCDPEIIDKLP